MLRYTLRRLLIIIPTMLGILLIIFTINFFTPGDPAQMALGSNYTEEAYQAKRAEMGLDKPFLIRYVDYVVGIVTRMDLGTSYDSGRSVKSMFNGRLGVTLRLGLWSCLITVVFGIGIGILSAVKQYSALDYSSTTLAVFFSAAPPFWLALMAILLFSLRLHLFRASGFGVLPVVTLALGPISLVMRITRTSMLDVIRQDYIRTARAKGVAERDVIFGHALKNALIPVLTVVGMQLSTVVAGSFIIESIFSIPGVGTLMLTAINNRDYPTIQGTVFILSAFVCVINLLVDLAYAFVDPRIKSEYVNAVGGVRKKKEASKA